MKRFFSILMTLALIIGIFPTSINAAVLDFKVYFDGIEYAANSSIHYQGDIVRIGIRAEGATSFILYLNGSSIEGSCVFDDGGGYKEYKLSSPGGAQTLQIKAGTSESSQKIINMYKDVIIDPNATYSYVSVQAIIKYIDGYNIESYLPESERTVTYIDGADRDEVNALFNKLRNTGKINPANGETYVIKGYLRVRVFDNNNTQMGEYNCSDKLKIPGTGPGHEDLLDYNWDSGTRQGLIQRGNWSANHQYTVNGSITAALTAVANPDTITQGQTGTVAVSIDASASQSIINGNTGTIDSYRYWVATNPSSYGTGEGSSYSTHTISVSNVSPNSIIYVKVRVFDQELIDKGISSTGIAEKETTVSIGELAPVGSPPTIGIDASPKTVSIGQSYTVIDKSKAISPAANIARWTVMEEFLPDGSVIWQTLRVKGEITNSSGFFKSYTKAEKGVYRYTLYEVIDNLGKTTTQTVNVYVTVSDFVTPSPTPTPTPSATPAPTPKPKPPKAAFDVDGTYNSETVHNTATTVVTNSIWITGQSTTQNKTIDDETYRIKYKDRYGSNILTVRVTRQPDGQYLLYYSGSTGTFKPAKESNTLIGSRGFELECKTTGTFFIQMWATDNTGTESDYDAYGYLEVTKMPPYTSLATPSMCFPKEITEYGGPKNTVTWDYSSVVNTPYRQSYIKVVKVDTSGNAIETVLDEYVSERRIIITGSAKERFKITVKVQDTAETWSSEASKTIYIVEPFPYVEVVCDERGYIGFPLKVATKIDKTTYPYSLFEQNLPSNYTYWQIVDLDGKEVIRGEGKVPDQITLDSSFQGYKNYTVRQYISNIVSETAGADMFITVSPPSPAVTMTSMTTYIDESIAQTVVITQPKPDDSYPDVPQVFDETNCHYRILRPDGTVLLQANGIFRGVDVFRSKGFEDSTDHETVYKLEQSATNSWGFTGKGIVELVVKRTPIPEIYLDVPDTYIDESVNVSRTIEDIFNTAITTTNARWKVEELDGSGNVLRQVDSGTGLADTLNIHSPAYEEAKTYRLTQYLTNRKGAEGSGTSDFLVFEAPPPEVQVTFKERDALKETLPFQIYPKESLSVETKINPGRFSITGTRWEVKSDSGTVVDSGTGQMNGLKTVYLGPGEYRFYQYGTNNKGKTGNGFADFIVREVLPPVVDIITPLDKDNPNNNLVYIGDTISFKGMVSEVNKSEENNNGFPIYTAWAVKDGQDQTVGGYRKEEVADTGILLTEGLFEQGKQYIFRQYAQNVLFPEKNSQKEVRFTIGNRKPVITANVVLGDGIPPLFTDEEVKIQVTIKDADGIIKGASFSVDGYDYTAHPTFWLASSAGSGLDTSTYTASFNYVGKATGNPVFKIVAMDDFGDSTEYEVPLQIVKPTVTADIQLRNEESIRKKQNRYIELDLTKSSSNAAALYPVDHRKNQMEYISPDGQWNVIPDEQNFSDENIRIHYPKYPDKSILSTYFKRAGEYKLYAKVFDTRDNASEFVERKVLIEEDQAPEPDFSITTPFYRITEDYIKSFSSISKVVNDSNIGKAFFVYNNMAVSPDGDELDMKEIYIIYDGNMNGTADEACNVITLLRDPAGGIDPAMEMVVSTHQNAVLKVKDLNNFKLTFLSDQKDLGNYHFQTYVRERITQLPADPNNPLYAELKALQKSAQSEYTRIFIDNKAPRISFEIETGKSINLIVHFDQNPAPEQEEKINELVNLLQQRGIKVNVIKKYNAY